MTYNQILFIAYVASIVVMSLVAFMAYLSDKKKAQKGAPRTKEKVLLGLAVLNGGFGAFIGRKVAHHKTDKGYFSLTIYLSMFMEIVVCVVLGILAFAN